MKKIKKNEIADTLDIDIQAYYRLEKRYPKVVKFAKISIYLQKYMNDMFKSVSNLVGINEPD